MRSNRLVISSFIVAYVAAMNPRSPTTGKIAKAVQEHPSRVRALIGQLAKAGILSTTRGTVGGVQLARSAADINLLDVLDAVGGDQIIAMEIPDPFSRWGGHCLVHPILSGLFLRVEADIREHLARTTIAELFRPFADDADAAFLEGA